MGSAAFSQPVILRRLKATNPNFYFVFDESEKCQGQTALMMETTGKCRDPYCRMWSRIGVPCVQKSLVSIPQLQSQSGWR